MKNSIVDTIRYTANASAVVGDLELDDIVFLTEEDIASYGRLIEFI